MNWFERYAVVGTYFLLILFLGLCGLRCDNIFRVACCPKEIIALLAFAVLPVGYFISLLSQIFYYRGIDGMLVHKEAVKLLEKSVKEKLDIYEYEDEKTLESKITIETRLVKDNSGIEFLSKFASKRWDILALNSALRLSTLLIVIILFIVKIWIGRACDFLSIDTIFFVAIWGFIILIISGKIDKISIEQLTRIIHSMVRKVYLEKLGK